MPWSTLAIPALWGAALLVAPGLLLAIALRLKGVLAFLVAPTLSIGLIGIGAILLSAAGIAWSPLAFSIFVIAAAILCASVSWVLLLRHRARHSGSSQDPSGGSHAAPDPWRISFSDGSPVAVAAATVLSTLLWVRHLGNMLGRPDAISQTFDNIFHINATRYILESRDGSSLTLGSLTDGGSALAFYPGAWHDLVSLIVLGSGASIPLAQNAAILVVASIAWPLSLITLLWCARIRHPLAIITTGVLAAAFPAFPLALLDFGVLYPNFLGLSLIPTMVGMTLLLVHGGEKGGFHWAQVLVVGFVAAVAMALAQPNSVLTFIGIAVCIMGAQTMSAAMRARWIPTVVWLTGTAAAVLSARAIWMFARPPFDGSQWESFLTVPRAVGEAMLQATMGKPASWFLATLVVWGVVELILRRNALWIILATVFLTFLWVVASAWPMEADRFFWVWPWYSDPYRLAAALPLTMAPLAAIGCFGGVERTVSAIGRVNRSGSPMRGVLIACIVVPLALVGLTQRTTAMNVSVDGAERSYALHDSSPLLTTDELAVLDDVRRLVPEDAVIVTDPWNGSSLAYGLTGRKTTTTQPLYDLSPPMLTLTNSLDDAAHSHEVCQALASLGATYVLDFGDQEINGYTHEWDGFDELGDAAGFELVSRHGDAALYRITACN